MFESKLFRGQIAQGFMGLLLVILEDPGKLVTREMILEGKIPLPGGGTMSPATPVSIP